MTLHSNGAHANGNGSCLEPSSTEMEARRPAGLRSVSVHRLLSHPLQPPERHSDANVAELKHSIEELGILDPPTVWLRPDGTYVILFGHRRVRAWQLLAMAGVVKDRIRVFVRDDLTEADAALLVAAEYGHQREFSAVHTARVIGEAHRALVAECSGAVPVRRLSAVLPWEKSSIHDYLRIHAALRDPRTRELVQSMDKEGKTLLVKVVSQPRVSTRVRLLKAYKEGGVSAVRKGLKAQASQKSAAPEEAVTRAEQDGGYDVTIRLRHTMRTQALDNALATAKELVADLTELKRTRELNTDSGADLGRSAEATAPQSVDDPGDALPRQLRLFE